MVGYGYVAVSLSLHDGRTIHDRFCGFWAGLMANRATRYLGSIAAVIAPTAGLLGAAMFVAVTVLSPLHPQLLELDPLHGHMVIGGTRVDQARALAAHIKGSADHPSAPSEQQADDPCTEDHSAEAHVLSIRGGGPIGSSVFSVSAVIAGDAPALLPAVLPVVRLIMRPELPARMFTPSVPDPPPRIS